MRYRLRVAYHGAAYHGWQIQTSVPTVEAALTAAVERLVGEPRKVWAASRTDAGVHASGQVAAFDGLSRHGPEAVYRALNHLTPRDIAVRAVDVVPDDFHPRHHARGKTYTYDLWTTWHVNPMLIDRALHVRGDLDATAMREAGSHLLGEHDFSAFRGAGCQAATPIRTLWEVAVDALEDGRLRVQISGSAFLKYMVRTLVGTLVEVGQGRRPPEWVADVLTSRDRRRAGATLAAHGLTLQSIRYPSLPPLGDQEPGSFSL